MPDANRIERELLQAYSKPVYSSMFEHRNRFEMTARRTDPQSLAKRAAQSLVSNRLLLNPVSVEELSGEVEFYRAYDGISSEQGTAMTLGASWTGRPVIERIWRAAQKSGPAPREMFMDFLRSANFIHPSWNKMKYIACMRVPKGARVVVIRGRGNWEAMRTNKPGARPPVYPKPAHPFDNPKVETVDDVLYSLRTIPTPGEEQCNIPLFNDMWVKKIPDISLSWPLA
jgi:hypothetical protein